MGFNFKIEGFKTKKMSVYENEINCQHVHFNDIQKLRKRMVDYDDVFDLKDKLGITVSHG